MEQGQYRIVRWTDEHGENTVAGHVVGPRIIRSLGYGLVQVPVGAVVFRPQRPEMVEIGRVR